MQASTRPGRTVADVASERDAVTVPVVRHRSGITGNAGGRIAVMAGVSHPWSLSPLKETAALRALLVIG
jgi:hypothetical protein